jgi:putative transcriptional regulator
VTKFGESLIESLNEIAAWKRGEVGLEVVNVEPMSPGRIKAIRRKAARSTKAFEATYGISAATMNNWEQGRRAPDPAARLLLKTIEGDPEYVAKIARGA